MNRQGLSQESFDRSLVQKNARDQYKDIFSRFTPILSGNNIKYESNLMEKVGQNLINSLLNQEREQLKELINRTYFGIGYSPNENVGISLERNAPMNGMMQDWKAGIKFNF